MNGLLGALAGLADVVLPKNQSFHKIMKKTGPVIYVKKHYLFHVELCMQTVRLVAAGMGKVLVGLDKRCLGRNGLGLAVEYDDDSDDDDNDNDDESGDDGDDRDDDEEDDEDDENDDDNGNDDDDDDDNDGDDDAEDDGDESL